MALLMVPMLAGTTANADSDGERAALERLVKEIQLLEPLVQEAERQADPADRSRFAYDWLREDLERMKTGIRQHLERPRTEPATVRPLTGRYGN